jgi:hypothetical protein
MAHAREGIHPHTNDSTLSISDDDDAYTHRRPVQHVSMALWHCDTVALWHCGSVDDPVVALCSTYALWSGIITIAGIGGGGGG